MAAPISARGFSAAAPGVAYVYAPDRKAERPISHLAGFRGVLQVDGYGGYKVLAERGEVQLAFCWSHVRRRFYELAQSGPAPGVRGLKKLKADRMRMPELTGISSRRP